ncbi:stage VI sporulation protein F [Brevibacillus daliensis]|uniref:stage VI sporulation protein F n=1 Tax=Brevibacillus daliensis TaxID=2892995 RepID=UPI001E4E6CC6|nr:stage VI sporulation protein F [Brevibacillus daliensis]
MDLAKLLRLAQGVNKEKLKSDEGIRDVIKDLARKTGKEMTRKDLDNYVAQVKKVMKQKDIGGMLDQLKRKGFDKNDLDTIRRNLKK